ncbi:unnamed protein product, partial [Prorocentrum cordatum]
LPGAVAPGLPPRAAVREEPGPLPGRRPRARVAARALATAEPGAAAAGGDAGGVERHAALMPEGEPLLAGARVGMAGRGDRRGAAAARRGLGAQPAGPGRRRGPGPGGGPRQPCGRLPGLGHESLLGRAGPLPDHRHPRGCRRRGRAVRAAARGLSRARPSTGPGNDFSCSFGYFRFLFDYSLAQLCSR